NKAPCIGLCRLCSSLRIPNLTRVSGQCWRRAQAATMVPDDPSGTALAYERPWLGAIHGRRDLGPALPPFRRPWPDPRGADPAAPGLRRPHGHRALLSLHGHALGTEPEPRQAPPGERPGPGGARASFRPAVRLRLREWRTRRGESVGDRSVRPRRSDG